MKSKVFKVEDLGAQAEIQALAANIRIARKRRKRSLADIAVRVGVSASTIFRLESGDPTVSIGTFVQVLSVLGLLRGLASIIAPENDVAQTLEEVRDLRAKKRAPSKKTFSDDELNF